MILVDYREETKTQKAKNLDLMQHFKKLGLPVQQTTLPFGDMAFEGQGPDGTITVGIERKRLHDILSCINDGRFNEQRRGMQDLYMVNILMVEAHWKPNDPNGVLMEGFENGHAWGYSKPGGQAVMYSKLFRYLISVQLAGVHVNLSRDPFHTAFNVGEWYGYFQKKWDQHTSMLDLRQLAIPVLNGKPTLTQEWAARLPGIGTKLSAQVAKRFRSPLALATADEKDWMSLPGVGLKMAQRIVKEIMGGH